MKVILREDIANIGKKFDVKEVSGGYARNFLFPKKLAELATPETLKKVAKFKLEQEKEDAALKKNLVSIAETLKEKFIIFDMKTDEKGRLFGSVTKEMILKALRSQGIVTKERVELKMEHPLKEIGEYVLDLDLKKGVKTKLKVILRSQP